jgi:hypothetical protein
LVALLAAVALRTGVTLITLFAARREHIDLDLAADDIDDKIRNGERGDEQIAQTLTSRCSMSG